MSKKGENIYKRKDGRWEGRYVRGYDATGKSQWGYVYGKTYCEVKQRLVEKKIYAMQNPTILKTHPTTYSELLNTWLSSTKINTKESTFARYTHLINTHIRPNLGSYQLSRISTQLIEEYIEQQLTNGRLDKAGGLAPKTVTDILTIIKSTMEYAKYNNLNIGCNFGKINIKKKEKEMRVFTPMEQESLIRVLVTEMDLYKFGVLLSLYTGIRIGELCALQWEDISLSERVLKVRKTMQRIQNVEDAPSTKTKVIITEPKSLCSIRTIPLPTFISEIACNYVANPKAFILTGDVSHYVEPRTMQNRFKGYVRESGIASANFHALRHTFATRCVEVGFELKSLSEILGHANVNITLNRYVHSSLELKHLNMNKLTFQA